MEKKTVIRRNKYNSIFRMFSEEDRKIICIKLVNLLIYISLFLPFSLRKQKFQNYLKTNNLKRLRRKY